MSKRPEANEPAKVKRSKTGWGQLKNHCTLSDDDIATARRHLKKNWPDCNKALRLATNSRHILTELWQGCGSMDPEFFNNAWSDMRSHIWLCIEETAKSKGIIASAESAGAS